MTGPSHSIGVHTAALTERKDVVHLVNAHGFREIITGDVTKGIKVPPGCTIERIELGPAPGGVGSLRWTGDQVETVRLDLGPGAVNYGVVPA